MCEMGLIKKANTCLKKKKEKKPFNKLGLELDKELLCQSALAQPASQPARSVARPQWPPVTPAQGWTPRYFP